MKLSIIIPTLNEESYIIHCLDSIVSQNDHGFETTEVIVVDGGSSDNTLKKLASFNPSKTIQPIQVLESEPGRAVQMNVGARLAKGEVLLFLHADSQLTHSALYWLYQNMQLNTADYGYFRLSFQNSNILGDLYAEATRINSIFFHYGDCGIFSKQDFFFDLGAFPEIDLMEDFEFLLRAVSRSEPLLIHEASVITSARRFHANGFLWQQLKNFGLVSLYMLGVDPAILKKLYT